MSFNYPLAKEIYGQPWSVDVMSFVQLTAILKNLQNGISLDVPDVKLNSINVLEVRGETRLINNQWELSNSEKFEGVGIVNLNGVITKNGGESSFGTKQLASKMKQMTLDERIKGFIILTDSGGGATGAVKLMQDAVNEVKKTKPVYALIEKGGMAGSAAYGIISSATEIYSEDDMNIVGSAGTMIQFSGKPNGTIDSNGEKHITLYASKSTAKNKGFEEAIENDNYKLLINDLLDPINESFLSSILSNRPQLQGSSFHDGHTVFSKDAVGTFIDGIASFDEVVNKILSNTLKNNITNSNINSNSNNMNKQELKQEHPELYSDILAEGISNERERVASWEAYRDADSKVVSEGISSGLPISAAQSHQLLVSLANKGKINALSTDNAPELVVAETATIIEQQSNSKELELEEAFKFNL